MSQQIRRRAQSESLIGSIFAEAFNRKFKRADAGSASDSHADLEQYQRLFGRPSMRCSRMPVYKRLNASAGFIDSYLNNPPPAFRKNSVQLTMGVTYALP